MNPTTSGIPETTLADWRRLLDKWRSAYLTDPDDQVLRGCGVSVAQRVIAQLERDASTHAPAGKVTEACLSGS